MRNDFKSITYKGTDFEVNSEGIIKKNNKIIHQRLNHDGYPEIWFRADEGIRYGTTVRTHQLVALAFVPNPENKPEVHHKDYDRANPSAENLEWVTHRENILHSLCNRPDYHGENNPNFGNRKLSKIYANDKEYAKEKQGRPGLKNGRCRKVELYYDNVFVKKFDYMEQCLSYMIENYSECKIYNNTDSLRSNITKYIKNNMLFKKHFIVKYV